MGQVRRAADLDDFAADPTGRFVAGDGWLVFCAPSDFWGAVLFGRPDLSIRHVPQDAIAPASDLCNRLIETQAYGRVIPDGPLEGMLARTSGSLEDPDFNNRHIELAWPLSV